jgi:hypothetical protein
VRRNVCGRPAERIAAIGTYNEPGPQFDPFAEDYSHVIRTCFDGRSTGRINQAHPAIRCTRSLEQGSGQSIVRHIVTEYLEADLRRRKQGLRRLQQDLSIVDNANTRDRRANLRDSIPYPDMTQ